MLKAAAYDCLGGKRKSWGLQTRWHGNYLVRVRKNHTAGIYYYYYYGAVKTYGFQNLYTRKMGV